MSDSPSLTTGAPASWPRPRVVAAAGLIIAATVATYFPSIRGGFILDDLAHVTKPELRSLHGLYRIWFDVRATAQYYPLLHTAFWIEHRFWGDEPMGYHWINIALHACAAVLVMLILRRLLSEKRLPWADHAAFLAAAVFALHPVHVESVAWISEQKNTLSGVFYLAAILAYLRFDRTRQKSLYLLATAFFVLSLLTKTVTVTLPAAMLVIFWWRKGRLEWKRDIAPLLPWFVISVVSGLFTAWVEKELIGAKGQAFEFSTLQRLLLAGRIVWFYLYKLIWPADLVFIYPRWTVDSAVWWQWLFTPALIALFAVLLAGSRGNRAPLAAMLLFVGSLFPILGFFNVYYFTFSFVADHFQYLPSLGVIALACAGAEAALTQISRPGVRAVSLLALPIALGILTFRQSRLYSDEVTLYNATLQRNPNCYTVHYNLGIALNATGRYEEAIAEYQEALRLRPDFPESLGNLAITLRKTGRLHEAVDCLHQALRQCPTNAEMYNNLGGALNAMGRYDEAIAAYQESLRLKPDSPDVLGNLILPLTNAGRLQEAINRSSEALRLDPDNPRIHIYLGIALNKAGRLPEAVKEYDQAIRLQPDFFEAHWNRALACDALGRFPEALAAAERALDLARSSGKVDLAQKIDAWIAACRARGPATRP